MNLLLEALGEEKATDAKLTAGCEFSTNCQSPPSIHGPRASLPFDISRRLRSVNEKNDESVTADARNMRAFGKHVDARRWHAGLHRPPRGQMNR
nr:hypothetical protein [Caballeronia telluris]